MPYNSFKALDKTRGLVSEMRENEIGPILLDYSGSIDLESKNILVYDFDLCENSTFNFGIDQTSLLSFSDYFDFYPSIGNSIESITSLNLINKKPIDFDNLNTMPFIDPNTGIANKKLNFNV